MRQRVFGIEAQDRAECCQRTVCIAELKESDAQPEVGGKALGVEFNGAAIERHRALQVALLKEHLGTVMGNVGRPRSVPSLSVGTSGGSKQKKENQASHILCDSGSSDIANPKYTTVPLRMAIEVWDASTPLCSAQHDPVKQRPHLSC